MSRGLIARVGNVNRTRRPEDSVALRVAVLAAVLTACVALLVERAISAATGAALLVLLPLAYLVSYRRRAKDNLLVKLVLAFAAVLALLRFLGQMRGVATLDEVRFPLAELFLWVQVLHSFDLPQRKDLNFSLASSLALLAVAGSISQDLRFAAILVVYFPCAIAALGLVHRSEARARSSDPESTPRAHAWSGLVKAGVAAGVAAAALFLVIPQPSGARALVMPFSLGGGMGTAGRGGIVNPGFTDGFAGRSSGASYHGFSARMDLLARGDLPDDLVMRVRASAPAMWKGMVFDTYDGVSWTGDASEGNPLPGPPYLYPTSFRSLGPRAEVTQTFYIEREQPNVVFAAGQPDAVWLAGGVGIDELGGLRTPATLTPGSVYSVVSSRGAARPDELRRASGSLPPSLHRYLQLPAGVPARVRELAQRITEGATNDLDRVLAIESYLRSRFRYSIDSPVPPPGRDAVDHFLFDAKVGFCEQFASATAVMLRSLGIPARVVAGYAVGRRNPFTGLYEVRASDAHAWVEVWFPAGLGWYEFDPTFDVPPARVDASELLPLAGLARSLAGAIPRLDAPSTGIPLVVGAGVLGAVALYALYRRGAVGRRRRGEVPPAGEAGPVARAFRRLEHALAQRGILRGRGETARELLARGLRRQLAPATLAAFEQERYGAIPPAPPQAARAAEELERLAREMEEEALRS